MNSLEKNIYLNKSIYFFTVFFHSNFFENSRAFWLNCKYFFSITNISLLYSEDLTERINKAEKSVSDAEDAFAIGSKGHFQSLEDLLEVRKN